VITLLKYKIDVDKYANNYVLQNICDVIKTMFTYFCGTER